MGKSDKLGRKHEKWRKKQVVRKNEKMRIGRNGKKMNGIKRQSIKQKTLVVKRRETGPNHSFFPVFVF